MSLITAVGIPAVLDFLSESLLNRYVLRSERVCLVTFAYRLNTNRRLRQVTNSLGNELPSQEGRTSKGSVYIEGETTFSQSSPRFSLHELVARQWRTDAPG
jgi:hypothetical protein